MPTIVQRVSNAGAQVRAAFFAIGCDFWTSPMPLQAHVREVLVAGFEAHLSRRPTLRFKPALKVPNANFVLNGGLYDNHGNRL